MATTSRIPAAEDALKSILTARLALAAVRVDVGYPAPAPEPEHIWIGGEYEDWEQETITTDPDKQETFTVPVKIIVQQSTEAYTDVRNRLFALVAEVEEAVRADPKLANTVWEAEVIGARRGPSEHLTDDGRGIAVTLGVFVRSFLQ